MIFAHLVTGLMPVEDSHFSIFWFLGSIIPDIDHPIVLLRHHIYKWANIVESMEHERRYHIHYRTPYFHSFLGALVVSAPMFYISFRGGLYFLGGYIGHLILDWPDIDEKQYFYPFKHKVKGVFPVFSNFEKVFTLFLVTAYVYINYLNGRH